MLTNLSWRYILKRALPCQHHDLVGFSPHCLLILIQKGQKPVDIECCHLFPQLALNSPRFLFLVYQHAIKDDLSRFTPTFCLSYWTEELKWKMSVIIPCIFIDNHGSHFLDTNGTYWQWYHIVELCFYLVFTDMKTEVHLIICESSRKG